MRIRKAVISVALSAAAIGGMAATPSLASSALASSATTATTGARTPFVGHSVGGALLTRQSLHVGQVVDLVGMTGGRISTYLISNYRSSYRITNYRVTSAHRDGEAFYVTVQPRLQSGDGDLILFTVSNEP